MKALQRHVIEEDQLHVAATSMATQGIRYATYADSAAGRYGGYRRYRITSYGYIRLR